MGMLIMIIVLLLDFPSLPLPHQVKVGLSTLPGCKYGVFAKTTIRTETEMGPFVGHVRKLTDVQGGSHNPSLWEVIYTSIVRRLDILNNNVQITCI